MQKTALFHSPESPKLIAFQRKGYLTALDAVQFLGALHNEIADIVFLDPPFNLRKDYGFPALLEEADPECYEHYMRDLLREAIRVLKPGGALFLYHLPYWASRLAHDLNRTLQFRHWIAIAMKNGFARGRRLYPAHYALLYYTKGEPARFKRPRLRLRFCMCGRTLKDYGGYAKIVKKKGLNLSDFWDDLSPVRHKSRKLRSANQLPVVLTDRIVTIAGSKEGVLVDPFVGTGTSLVSAVKAKMFFVANDLSLISIRIAVSRLTSPRARA